jgi:hypothetical protein
MVKHHSEEVFNAGLAALFVPMISLSVGSELWLLSLSARYQDDRLVFEHERGLPYRANTLWL